MACFSSAKAIHLASFCSADSEIPFGGLPLSGSEHCRLLNPSVTTVQSVQPGQLAVLTDAQGNLVGIDVLTQECSTRNTSLRLVASDALGVVCKKKKESLLSILRNKSKDFTINIAHLHNTYRGLPRPVVDDEDIVPSSSGQPVRLDYDAALAVVKHGAFTFDGVCAAALSMNSMSSLLERKGLLPHNSKLLLDAIKKILVTAAEVPAGLNADTWLQEWAEVSKFRGQRNKDEAHPLSDEYAEELLGVFKQAVAAKHPTVRPFVHVASMAAGTAEAALDNKKQSMEQAMDNMRPCDWVWKG